MNKNILKLIVGICFIFIFIFYITAEENTSLYNSSPEEITQEEIIYLPLDLSNITINESYESESTNYSFELNESNLTSPISIDNTPNNTIEDYFSSSENSSSGDSDSGSSSDKILDYVDLTNISESNSETNPKTLDNYEQEESTSNCSLQSLGKAIEIKDCEGINILGINIEEVEGGELEKEVIISSEEHVNKTITINISLTTESEKDNIKIYWKNEENLEITTLEEFSVKYYDKNNNGLIDIISWDIPHLSEQIFRVIVGLNYSNESEENILLNVSGPSGDTRNPILFNISVNYSKNFSCNIQVGGIWENNFNSSKEYSLNLPNGEHNWGVVCIDPLNLSVAANATSGSFLINEEFSSSLQEGKLYFLNLVENKIKNPEVITINSTNPSNFTIKLIRNGQVIYTKNSSNYNTTLVMNEAILNSSGIYNLSVKFGEPSPIYEILRNFSVASANITFNTTQIQEGQSIKIGVSIISPVQSLSYVILDYGNGTLSYQSNPTNPFIKDFFGKYTSNGQYLVKLNLGIGGTSFEIQRGGITVTDVQTGADNDDPTITLNEPEDEKIIYGSAINFSYKASDNVKIKNCTFKLYNNCASMTSCSTSDSNLIFPTNSQQRSIANNDSVQNNKKVEVKLQEFDEGIYAWLVECYDNSSNYDWEMGVFRISLNGTSIESLEDYEQKEEVENLKEQADNFLTMSFSLEEKEVLEDLNLLNDTKYYKKRLLDIQNFFEENYKYVSSETLREKKTEEYLAELENMKYKIPKKITIKESYEYIKNSVDKDFESIVEEYFLSTNTQLGRASIQKLAKINKELQNEISVSTKVKNVEIDYDNGTQQIILVKKKIDLNDDSYDKILEIIPKEIIEDAEDIVFITENKVINEDPVFEISYEDLDEDELIYYINSQIKLKELEKTETVLFEDDLTKFETRYTGFLVINSFSSGFALYFIIAIVLLVVLLIIGPFVFRKFRMLSWKKEPNVVKVIGLIEDIQRLLSEREIEKAREAYYKIKEIYPVLPYKTKAYFYEKINEMLIKIDKKDIFGLVKEYQEAKKRWNKEEIMRLYEDIKKIYKRLPEKDRKRVYDIINGY